MIIAAMMLIYVVLGTVMEELTMVLLTIPLFFPIVTSLGFDCSWFGVLIVMIVQIGLISPPVGMNLFVLNSLLPNVGLGKIFKGCWPFVLVLIFCTGAAGRLSTTQFVVTFVDETGLDALAPLKTAHLLKRHIFKTTHI